MVIELRPASCWGLGIGYGLDVLFGTLPIFLIIFSLFGFAAGVKTMLGTARQSLDQQAKRRRRRPPRTKGTDDGDGRHAGGLQIHPMDQFVVKPLFGDGPVCVVHPHQRHALDGHRRSGDCCASGPGTRRRAIVPSRGQSVAELFYGFIHKMVEDVAGHDGPEVLPLCHDAFHVRLPVEHAGPDPDVLHHHLAHRGHGDLAMMVFLTVTIVGFVPQGHRLPVDVLGLVGAAGAAADPGRDRGDFLLRAPAVSIPSVLAAT
jgi:hypothetical protein